MGYIYLASPYSANTLQVRVNRFMAAQDATIWLLKNGHAVYSPIQVWHHIAELQQLPKDYEFWRNQNDAMLDGARIIGVLAIPGWRESQGLKFELERARKLDLDCWVLVPDKEDEYIIIPKPLESWTSDLVLKG